MALDKENFWGLMNLHDVFLNASLLRKNVLNSPLSTDTREFDISDRGRFERMWVANLYVLVEAWNSLAMKEVREYIASKVDIQPVSSILAQGYKDGSLKKWDKRGIICFIGINENIGILDGLRPGINWNIMRDSIWLFRPSSFRFIERSSKKLDSELEVNEGEIEVSGNLPLMDKPLLSGLSSKTALQNRKVSPEKQGRLNAIM